MLKKLEDRLDDYLTEGFEGFDRTVSQACRSFTWVGDAFGSAFVWAVALLFAAALTPFVIINKLLGEDQ